MTDALSVAIVTGTVAIFGGLVTVALALINKNVKEYHKEVNSKMSIMLENKDALSASREETAGLKGEMKGAQDNQAITDAKKQDKK